MLRRTLISAVGANPIVWCPHVALGLKPVRVRVFALREAFSRWPIRLALRRPRRSRCPAMATLRWSLGVASMPRSLERVATLIGTEAWSNWAAISDANSALVAKTVLLDEMLQPLA